MTIVEFFDPRNIDHMTAWVHLGAKGTWPEGFLPDGVEFPPTWSYGIAMKIALYYAVSWLGCPLPEDLSESASETFLKGIPNAPSETSRYSVLLADLAEKLEYGCGRSTREAVAYDVIRTVGIHGEILPLTAEAAFKFGVDTKDHCRCNFCKRMKEELD